MNSGNLKFGSDIEMQAGVFNTSNSRLWTRVRELFADDILNEWKLLRQDRFTLDNIMKYLFDDQIDKIPERYYNIDMWTKYLNFGSQYLYACHGNDRQRMERWIRERIMYVDTMLGYTIETQDYITLRANKLGEIFLDIQTFIPMYLSIKFRNEYGDVGTLTKRVGRGETTRFTYTLPSATDQEILVYGGRYLKDIGDISNLNCSTMIIGNAVNLTRLKTNSEALINLDLSKNTLLQYVDISGCKNLKGSLNMKDNIYLRELDASGSSLSSIILNSTGGSLESIKYPETIQTVELRNLYVLNNVNIPAQSIISQLVISNCPRLQTLRGNPELDNSLILNNISKLELQNTLTNMTNFEIIPTKLTTLVLRNMNELESIVIGPVCTDDLVSPILESIHVDTMPKLKSFKFSNLRSSGAVWTEAGKNTRLPVKDGLILDLSTLTSLETFEDRLLVKGLTQLLVPSNIKNIRVTNGSNNMVEVTPVVSDITDIWCPLTCEHEEGFHGFDGKGLVLDTLIMTYLLKIPAMINCQLKPKSQLRVNINRTEETAITPKGIIDYSELTSGVFSYEFRWFNDVNDELTLIMPDWTRINNVIQTFENATLNISWDVANNLLESSTIDGYTLYKTFAGAKLKPFESYTGLDVDNSTIRCEVSDLFSYSNLPKIVQYKMPNSTNFSYHFKGCTLDNSLDIINDILSYNTKLETISDIFNGCKFTGGGFSAGLVLNHNTLNNMAAAFKDMVYGGNFTILSINLPKMTNMNEAFRNITINEPWDKVNTIFAGAPLLQSAESTFYLTKMQPSTDGINIRHNRIQNMQNCFYRSNLDKITDISSTSLTNLTQAFQKNAMFHTSIDFNNTWEVVNNILEHCPNLSDISSAFNYINMQPFPSGVGLKLNHDNIVRASYTFSNSNVNRIVSFNMPSLINASRMFNRPSEMFNDPSYDFDNTWDVIYDGINNSAIQNIDYICANCVMKAPTNNVWQLELPSVTSSFYAFYSYYGVDSRSTNLYVYLDKLNMPLCINASNMFYNADLYYAKNISAPKCTNMSKMFDGVRVDSNNSNGINPMTTIENVTCADECNMSSFVGSKKDLLTVNGINCKPSNINRFISNCPSLTSVGILDFTNITEQNAIERFIEYCPALTSVDTIGTIKIPIEFSYDSTGSTLVDVNSIVMILENLSDRTGLTSMTITLGSRFISKLTDDQISIALNKNWSVV